MRRYVCLNAWLVAGLAANLAGQGSPCDPQILNQTTRNDVDRYMRRGDRCEGVYLEPVSGDTGRIWVASFTRGATPTRWASPLRLEWPGYQGSAVTVQAYSLRPRFYYRLDSPHPAGVTRLEWPTDVVAKYLPPAELGLVAFTKAPIEGRPTRVYLPLARAAGATGYQLKMISTADLSSVELLVAGADGTPLQALKRLPVGALVHGQVFDVALPALPKPGVYKVSVKGQAARGAGTVSSEPLYIYHAP